ncbi:MAG: hypothetical protein QXH60_01920 [Candidatus Pacearchaeota archaeon]
MDHKQLYLFDDRSNYNAPSQIKGDTMNGNNQLYLFDDRRVDYNIMEDNPPKKKNPLREGDMMKLALNKLEDILGRNEGL